MDIKEALAGMDQRWKTEKSKVPGVPDGVYTMQLLSADVVLSKAGNNPMVERKHVVVDGEQEGQEIRDRLMLHTENGPYYANKWVEMMGYQSPEDMADLPEVIKTISEAHPIVMAEVRRSGEFLNVRVQQLLEENSAVKEAEAAPEETAPKVAPAASKKSVAKKATPAAEPAAAATDLTAGDIISFEFEGVPTQGVVEEVKEESAVVAVNEDRYEVPLGDLTKLDANTTQAAADGDAELTAELLAFAQTHNLPVEDGSTVEALKELIGGYEWKKAELTPDEVALLTKVEVEMTAPAKPVAKPIAKAAAKAAPAKAAPVKAAAKPVVKATKAVAKKGKK